MKIFKIDDFEVFAERELEAEDGSVYTLSIGKPERISDIRWACASQVKGSDYAAIHTGYGFDSMQALFGAQEILPTLFFEIPKKFPELEMEDCCGLLPRDFLASEKA